MLFAKRLVDLVGSAILLLLLSPILLLVSLSILVFSGKPVVYRQARLGKDGVPFIIYKFRTMIVDAPDIRNPDGSTYNADDDPRLTRVGRFLRRTSLDELPQLFNVLKGDMSLVGPRPDQVDQLQYYSEAERAKLSIKPGITGLAQINGRNAVPWEQRKKMDVDYAQNMSLKLDLEILAKTIPYVLLKRDVYINSIPSSGGFSDENPFSG